MAPDCLHYGQNLLRNDGQHLDLYPVELVKADPSAGRGQALEKLAHGLVIEAVGTIEHHALYGERLGQVFGGFSLASSLKKRKEGGDLSDSVY